jgi:hypothetical protein
MQTKADWYTSAGILGQAGTSYGAAKMLKH